MADIVSDRLKNWELGSLADEIIFNYIFTTILQVLSSMFAMGNNMNKARNDLMTDYVCHAALTDVYNLTTKIPNASYPPMSDHLIIRYPGVIKMRLLINADYGSVILNQNMEEILHSINDGHYMDINETELQVFEDLYLSLLMCKDSIVNNGSHFSMLLDDNRKHADILTQINYPKFNGVNNQITQAKLMSVCLGFLWDNFKYDMGLHIPTPIYRHNYAIQWLNEMLLSSMGNADYWNSKDAIMEAHMVVFFICLCACFFMFLFFCFVFFFCFFFFGF